MTSRDLVLNIAVNTSRIGRFLLEKRTSRIKQFILETNDQLTELSPHRLPESLKIPISKLQKLIDQNSDSAEDYFTYSAILTHRAKLA